MDSSLCLFPNIQQIPALGPVREHSSQRLLSFFAPFQNFNLISLSVLMSLFVARQTGPFFHRFNSETKAWNAPAPAPIPARSRPQTPSTLAAARDSSSSVKRAHSWAPPQSPSNSCRCFGFGLHESRCRTEWEGRFSHHRPTGATFSQILILPVSKTEPFPRNTAALTRGFSWDARHLKDVDT